MKKLAEKFEGHFECLAENIGKITFSVSKNKELENGKTITYKIKLLIDLGLFQAHYQVLLIIFLKDFTKMNETIENLVFNTCKSKILRLNIRNQRLN